MPPFERYNFEDVDFLELTIEEIKEIYDHLENVCYYDEARKNEFVEFVLHKAKEHSGEKINLSSWRNALVKDNGGTPLLYETTPDSLRRCLSNWKDGNSLPVFVRNPNREEENEYSNRNKYLDMLLYLGAHRDGSEVSIRVFNNVAKKHGLEHLYILDYVNFCMAVSIYLESKTGKNAYVTYRSLLQDEKLKEIASLKIAGRGQVTQVIKQDFERIEEIGSLDEIFKDGKVVSFQSETNSVYKFVAKYCAEFGRRHLSRYYALASLLYGESIDDLFSSGDRFYIFHDDHHGYADACATVRSVLSSGRYQQMLYLLGNMLTVGCYMFIEEDDTSRFTRNYIDEIVVELDEMYDNHTINIYNQSPKEFNEIMERTRNLPRDLLLLIILATMNKKVIRNYVDIHGDEELAKEKIKQQIDKMLDMCQMVSLDIKNGKYDFLLLLAIEKANYDFVIDDEDIDYFEFDEDGEEDYVVERFPYMDFLLNQFFHNN